MDRQTILEPSSSLHEFNYPSRIILPAKPFVNELSALDPSMDVEITVNPRGNSYRYGYRSERDSLPYDHPYHPAKN